MKRRTKKARRPVRPTNRHEGVRRALRLIRRLEAPTRRTVYQLAEEFEVSVRTMRRDLRLIESVGGRLLVDDESVENHHGTPMRLYLGIVWDSGRVFQKLRWEPDAENVP